VIWAGSVIAGETEEAWLKASATLRKGIDNNNFRICLFLRVSASPR
jgi:hypothetical protein